MADRWRSGVYSGSMAASVSGCGLAGRFGEDSSDDQLFVLSALRSVSLSLILSFSSGVSPSMTFGLSGNVIGK